MLELSEEELFELMSKLNGMLLRKAELLKDFDKVYSTALERAEEIEDPSSIEAFFLLGDVGG